MTEQCNVITGRNPRVRCTRDMAHSGPHWEDTEDLPKDCSCKAICYCKDKT